eukprot:3253185-Amphidinium_carterae.1
MSTWTCVTVFPSWLYSLFAAITLRSALVCTSLESVAPEATESPIASTPVIPDVRIFSTSHARLYDIVLTPHPWYSSWRLKSLFFDIGAFVEATITQRAATFCT